MRNGRRREKLGMRYISRPSIFTNPSADASRGVDESMDGTGRELTVIVAFPTAAEGSIGPKMAEKPLTTGAKTRYHPGETVSETYQGGGRLSRMKSLSRQSPLTPP